MHTQNEKGRKRCSWQVSEVRTAVLLIDKAEEHGIDTSLIYTGQLAVVKLNTRV